MARKRGKKALYEVMSKARQKPEKGRSVEPMPPKSPVESKPASKVLREKNTRAASKGKMQWLMKPRFVQYNAGRIEFSVPYQVAIAVGLVLILLILASYRLGQFSYLPPEQKPAQPSGLMGQTEQEDATEQATSDVAPSLPAPVETMPPQNERTEPPAEPAKPEDKNVIVLVQYHTPADLGPVQAFFAEHGIATEIRMRGGIYFLQTVDRYDNPNKPGTDGYEAKQKIIEIGKSYKAPSGYESFATHHFSDAYGMRVD